MGLLQPEAGVLFWMTLAFAVVFIVLARYGFPVIVRAIEERKAYIDRSLEEARAAERKLRELDAEGQAVRAAAERERGRILREAAETRDALDQGRHDNHVRPDLARSFGLTADGLHGGRTDLSDTETRADGRETCAECGADSS